MPDWGGWTLVCRANRHSECNGEVRQELPSVLPRHTPEYEILACECWCHSAQPRRP